MFYLVLTPTCWFSHFFTISAKGPSRNSPLGILNRGMLKQDTDDSGVGRAREVRGGAVRQAGAKGKAGSCYSQGRGLLRSHGGRVAGS